MFYKYNKNVDESTHHKADEMNEEVNLYKHWTLGGERAPCRDETGPSEKVERNSCCFLFWHQAAQVDMLQS